MRNRLSPLVLASAFAILGCIPDLPLPASGPVVGAPSVAVLKRGINAGNALDAPSEGAWGVTLTSSFFADAKAAGFDHVRIPIRFSAHAKSAAPYQVDEAFFRRVDFAVYETQSRGMTAIIDFHHYEELMEDPDGHAARFVGIWKQIAERYHTSSPSVVYELLNEPTKKMSADKWNALLVQGLAAVRAVDPTRKVIVESVFWAAAKELPNLKLPANDTNLIGSFHTYQPILFTHQGLSFMTGEYQTTGIVFPGPPKTPVTPVAAATQIDWVKTWFENYNTLPADKNPDGPVTIAEEFKFATDFMERTKLPLYMGEFGAGDKADRASRIAWTTMVRKEAEKHGIGWAYWEDGGSFSVYNHRNGTWDEELKTALLK